MSEAFLAHYGVKGMKWGKRKKTVDIKDPKSVEETFGGGLSADEVIALVKQDKSHRRVVFIGGKAYDSKTFSKAQKEAFQDLYSRANRRKTKRVRNISHSEDFLAHYGVLGMKWGVRKRRDGKGTFRSGPKAGEPANARDKDVVRKTKPSNTLRAKPQNRRMTDAELRNYINRLQMEKQLAQLTYTPAQKNAAKEWTKDFVKDVGTSVAKDVTKTVATAYLKRYLNVKIDAGMKNPDLRLGKNFGAKSK